MMQPSYQELVGKVMSNLTFGLTDGTFTWGRYAVFLICHGAALWSQCGVGIRAPLEGRHIGA
ncbi:hypothetical protein K6Y78_30290, partial [Burkholderia cenocepacia]|uniref:hypothetical protein n=1 Tax=Burkholderia cenocepacia TaxID=95486 RepID=UPI002230B559